MTDFKKVTGQRKRLPARVQRNEPPDAFDADPHAFKGKIAMGATVKRVLERIETTFLFWNMDSALQAGDPVAPSKGDPLAFRRPFGDPGAGVRSGGL